MEPVLVSIRLVSRDCEEKYCWSKRDASIHIHAVKYN